MYLRQVPGTDAYLMILADYRIVSSVPAPLRACGLLHSACRNVVFPALYPFLGTIQVSYVSWGFCGLACLKSLSHVTVSSHCLKSLSHVTVSCHCQVTSLKRHRWAKPFQRACALTLEL